jgi:hypothetical protein
VTAPRRPAGDRVRIILAALSLAVGVLLLVHVGLVAWDEAVFSPTLLVPFFDGLEPWAGAPVRITELAFAGLAIVTAILLFARRRLAPWAFVVGGWGTLLFTIAALWPGDRIKVTLRMLVTTVERSQGLPPGSTRWWDLVPTAAWTWAAIAVGLWLAILVLGSVHAVRRRRLYMR